MADAEGWTLIALLGGALFTLLAQMRTLDHRISDLTAEMRRGFGDLRGDIAVLRGDLRRHIDGDH